MDTFRRKISLASRGIVNYLRKRPLCVSFEVTYRCNARCKHCHLGGHVDETTASAERYGELSRLLRPVVAQVSGGEPLLRRDLEDIIGAIRVPERAPFIVVTTNAALLTRERYYRLREAGVDEFSVSLDYPDERHDEFRRIPGLFRKIESLIKTLHNENEKAITLSCVVQKDNFRALPRIAALAEQWKVRVNFSTYTWLRTNDKNYLIEGEDLAAFKKVVHELLQMRKQNKNFFASEYIFERMIKFFENQGYPNCRAGEKFLVVNPDGTLSPCGLIIGSYQSRDQILKEMLDNNSCIYCNTSIRANTEKPLRYIFKDNLRALLS